MAKLGHIIYNGRKPLIHTREDIAVLVKAYNLAVDKINNLEERIMKLEREANNAKQ